jgi:hypothetical protein
MRDGRYAEPVRPVVTLPAIDRTVPKGPVE